MARHVSFLVGFLKHLSRVLCATLPASTCCLTLVIIFPCTPFVILLPFCLPSFVIISPALIAHLFPIRSLFIYPVSPSVFLSLFQFFHLFTLLDSHFSINPTLEFSSPSLFSAVSLSKLLKACPFVWYPVCIVLHSDPPFVNPLTEWLCKRGSLKCLSGPRGFIFVLIHSDFDKKFQADFIHFLCTFKLPSTFTYLR